MATASPLQVLIFRHVADADTLPYEEAIVRAFQGGKEPAGYLATGEDLGVQLEVFTSAPKVKAATLLNSFSHNLAVVLADRNLLSQSDDAFYDWLAECWNETSASKGRHAFLVIAMEERSGRQFSQKRAGLERIQLLQTHELGEPAIRPAILALRIVHECRVLLANALPPVAGRGAGHLTLFISHAKMDGLPLAHALKRQIESMGWLRHFYDADDLPAGCDWQRELESGVGSSLIIMLRTEAYDTRHWCQQEVLWADEYATPAVLVDARIGLNHPASILPFDRVPTVRIPDGNLVRILFLALREGLRFLHFMRRVKAMQQAGELPKSDLKAFSFQPSMAALLRTCQSMAGTKTGVIVYPDPPLRAGLYEAAQALVSAYAPGVALLTPNTLAALGGKVP